MVFDVQVRRSMLPEPASKALVVGMIQMPAEPLLKARAFANVQYSSPLDEQIKAGPAGNVIDRHILGPQRHNRLRDNCPAEQFRAKPPLFSKAERGPAILE